MTHRFRASRRRALQQLAALAGAFGLHRPLTALACRQDREALEEAVADLLPARASAVAVGDAYLRRVPGEASAERLETLILGSTRAAGLPITPAGLRRRVERDFAEEKVVRLDGWLLSVTEVRLCAFACLRAAQEPRGG